MDQGEYQLCTTNTFENHVPRSRTSNSCCAFPRGPSPLVVSNFFRRAAARRAGAARCRSPSAPDIGGAGGPARAEKDRPRPLRYLQGGNAKPSSPATNDQPKAGKISGLDFYRDPLNADRPNQPPEEIVQKESANKAAVMAAQRTLLERRYNLEARPDPSVTMSWGKPPPVGPTARLAQGVSWQQIAEMSPGTIQTRDIFPYPPLPHPWQSNGGQVFPKIQIQMFPRLERFDVEFDIPDAFIPEFPPGIFLTNRPGLGDVSRGEVISINNYHRLFKDILTPVQLDGLRLLLTAAAHSLPAGRVQSHRRSQEQGAESRRNLLRLSRERTYHRTEDSPPYMHDGRCLTLEDTVEFFNIVLQTKMTAQEKKDLVAFLRQL
jgi:hypothetical protein